jgi:hypothetical protein
MNNSDLMGTSSDALDTRHPHTLKIVEEYHDLAYSLVRRRYSNKNNFLQDKI